MVSKIYIPNNQIILCYFSVASFKIKFFSTIYPFSWTGVIIVFFMKMLGHVLQKLTEVVYETLLHPLDSPAHSPKCYIAMYTNMAMCEIGEMDIECWFR